MYLLGPRRYSSPEACTSPTTGRIPKSRSVILASQNTCRTPSIVTRSTDCGVICLNARLVPEEVSPGEEEQRPENVHLPLECGHSLVQMVAVAPRILLRCLQVSVHRKDRPLLPTPMFLWRQPSLWATLSIMLFTAGGGMGGRSSSTVSAPPFCLRPEPQLRPAAGAPASVRPRAVPLLVAVRGRRIRWPNRSASLALVPRTGSVPRPGPDSAEPPSGPLRSVGTQYDTVRKLLRIECELEKEPAPGERDGSSFPG